MRKIILTKNPLRFNLEPLLKYFQMSFVHESPYAVCNGRVSGCCQIESGSTCLLWKFHSTLIRLFFSQKTYQVLDENVKLNYLHNLSNFSGVLDLFSWRCSAKIKNNLYI